LRHNITRLPSLAIEADNRGNLKKVDIKNFGSTIFKAADQNGSALTMLKVHMEIILDGS